MMRKNKNYKKVLAIIVIMSVIFLIGYTCKGTKNKGYVDLFDGQSLSGWHVNEGRVLHGEGGLWQVEDGVLTGEQDPPGSGNGGILMTDQKYGDFELMIDLKPDWGIDSGVFIRTSSSGECYQIYVDYKEGGQVGFIATETRTGKGRMYIRPFSIVGVYDDKGNLKEIETRPDGRKEAWGPGYLNYACSPEDWKKAWKVGEWNTLKVRCIGEYPRITTWINGVKIADFDGETSKSPIYKKEELRNTLGTKGYIGLQVHGGKKSWEEGSKCRWKNIRIKTL